MSRQNPPTVFDNLKIFRKSAKSYVRTRVRVPTWIAENYTQNRMHGTSILKGPSSKIINGIAFVRLEKALFNPFTAMYV
jgi:uncharacterized alpha-E superfamily protein